MTEFTPMSALAGGAMIGLAAVMLMATLGRVAGISSILGRLLPPAAPGGVSWRIAFIAGMLAAPFLVRMLTGTPVEISLTASIGLMAVAGFLVGLGSGIGGGCTSGHGVCGIARISLRSIAATATFMTVAIVTVFVARHVVGG